MNNIVQQFQAICGEFSMNKMVAQAEGNWTANLWRGGRKIGTVMYVTNIPDRGITVMWNPNHVTLMIPSEEDRTALLKWADAAGPYGFESPEDFVMHLYKWAQMLIEMRTAVRKGHLVAFARNGLDPHDMPIYFNASKNKVTDTWISGYAKANKNMQVVNQAVA